MVQERTVLLLGDFKQGGARLQAIRESLARFGYHAVLLEEIPEEPNYDLQQKFQAVASVCRFLVFEDSTPSGQIAELILAEGLRSVRIILRQGEAAEHLHDAGNGSHLHGGQGVELSATDA